MKLIRKIAVLGCGNMAYAMMSTLSKKLSSKDYLFLNYNPSRNKADLLTTEINKNCSAITCLNLDFLSNVDLIFFGFKPQQYLEVVGQIKPILNDDVLIFSVLAGVTINQISMDLNTNNVIRSMPNTPMLIGEGVNFISFSKQIDLTLLEDSKELIHKISNYYIIDENKMDIITPVTGSGPAYLFLLGEILSSYLQKNGFDQTLSNAVVKQTLYGASALWKSKELPPEQLRLQVTSKNGVTDQVVNSLTDQKIFKLFFKALDLGVLKSKKLGN